MEGTSGAKPSVGAELTALFSNLVRLETELWDCVDQRLRYDHDLPLSWFEPMEIMNRTPDCRVADVAHTLSITVGGTSKLIDRIERSGWCLRTPNPDDSRSSFLRLTPAGHRILGVARTSFEDELERSLGAVMSPRQRELLSRTVGAARRRLVQLPRSGR